MKRNSLNVSIFHELGHVIGYMFANRSQETSLGKYRLTLGEKNYVEPFFNPYLISNQDCWKNVTESTRNTKRTIAYIIKGLLGSVFQSIYTGDAFMDILHQNGRNDFSNIKTLSSLSFFKWTTMEVEEIGNDLVSAFSAYNLKQDLEDIVTDLSIRINQISETPRLYTIDFLEVTELEEDISLKTDEALHSKYLLILEKWTTYFQQKQYA